MISGLLAETDQGYHSVGMTAAEDTRPLAARMRPRTLDEFSGQEALLGKGGPLRALREGGRLHSMILWGPPGSGKTTLARLIAETQSARFVTLSAVESGVKEIRAAAQAARESRLHGQSTVLFVDEIHRFHKGQQDALLPFVEEGLLTLVGATTENPSFALVGALLSRARVHVLQPLGTDELSTILDAALSDPERGLGKERVRLEPEARNTLVASAEGDARRLLTTMEIAVQLAPMESGVRLVDLQVTRMALGRSWRHFDRGGEHFFNEISAFHKSLRGSDPNAALYWLARMLDGGADPLYLARRMVRMASEDIGLADPRALQVALAARDAYAFLGSPEGELALVEAAIYLASAPKSNGTELAWNAVRESIRRTGSLDVPLHLRNAPTRLMRDLEYGKKYQYDHDFPDAISPEQQFLPPGLSRSTWYVPSDRGFEARIAERLQWIAAHRKTRGE